MIDPNEAPKGFVAAPSKHACAGCHFCDQQGDCSLMDFTCYPSQRKDGENVIFIPREKAIIPQSLKTVKTGDIIMIGIEVPEEYDGETIEQTFKEFIEEPHGWSKTLEGIKRKDAK